LDKEQRLMHTAFVMFSERGCSVSAEELAAQAGLPESAVHDCFGGRSELLRAAMEAEIDNHFAYLQRQLSLESHDAGAQLYRGYRKALEYFTEEARLSFWRHMFLVEEDALRSFVQTKIQRCERQVEDRIQAIFEFGSLHGQLEMTLMPGAMYVYLALVRGMLDRMFMYGISDIESSTYVKQAWEAYWHSIRAKGTAAEGS